MALCHLKLCGRVKAHVIAINKFAWPVTHSWVLISSHLLQLLCTCHFRGNHGSEDTGSEEEKDCSGESNTRTISSSSLRLLMWMWNLPRQKCRWSSLICSAPMNSSHALLLSVMQILEEAYSPDQRFPGLVDNAMRIVAAFGCTYGCEQLFSRMKLTKSKSRAQLTDGHLNDVLLLSVSSVAPDISSLSAQKQH